MMSHRHNEILTKKRLLLIRGLKVTESLLACLRVDYTLTNEMQQEIDAERTDARRASALLDTLVRRGENAFDRFIYAMIETDQDALALALDDRLAKKYINLRDAERKVYEQHVGAVNFGHAGGQNPGLQGGQPMFPGGGQQLFYGIPMAFFPMISAQLPSHAMGYTGYSQFQPSEPSLSQSGAMVTQPTQDDRDNSSSLPRVTYQVDELRSILQEINGIDGQLPKAEMTFTIQAATNLCQSQDTMVYPTCHIPRGHAVIINNKYFVSDKYGNRDGAEHDGVNLKELFEQLSFKVIVHENLSAEDIRIVLKKESQDPDHEDADMFVLFLLSHGNQGNIYGSDGESLSIENDITALFYPGNCPALRGKPKVFFIQACQGRMRSGLHATDSDKCEDKDLDENLIKKLKKLELEDKEGFVPEYHKTSDMVMSYATVKGYLAWRRSDLGSWFVRCLVSVFSRRAHSEHLLDMLTETNFLLSNLETSPLEGRSHQCAEKTDTLNKKLYFFPSALSKAREIPMN